MQTQSLLQFERPDLEKRIFEVKDDSDFNSVALEVFRFQYSHCEVYRQWVDLLGVKSEGVERWEEIPALPIELFKSRRVVSFFGEELGYFQSSGTTGMEHSHHYFHTMRLYEQSLLKGFESFWGDPSQYFFLAILPNYLHQGHSSLIYMMRCLIEKSGCEMSGFYDSVTPELLDLLRDHSRVGRKLVLFGVSYALLDIVEKEHLDLSDSIVFETGGMKGRRKEMVKSELHQILCEGFNVEGIASEYGMTELFAQAYSKGGGVYSPVPWLKLRIRDVNAPMRILPMGKNGGIDLIDLSNLYSCSFLSTQDMGCIHEDGSFEVKGRFDYSDVRGCNLMSEM